MIRMLSPGEQEQARGDTTRGGCRPISEIMGDVLARYNLVSPIERSPERGPAPVLWTPSLSQAAVAAQV